MWRKPLFPLIAAAVLLISMPVMAEKSAKSTKAKGATPAPAAACVPKGALQGKDLCGQWKLVSEKTPGKEVGTLTANGRFFTVDIIEPEVSLTAAYTQGDNGDFRCTIIDKKVLIMEGAFQSTDRLAFAINVKEMGKPDMVNFPMTAVRISDSAM